MELTEEKLYVHYILEKRTQKEIMKMYGITKSMVERMIRKAELRKQTDVPDSFERMYNEGWTYAELAEYYGVDESNIMSWRKRTGLRRKAYFTRKKA